MPTDPEPIDTADEVLHKPTGEHWTVASVRDGYLYWVGWPPGRAPLVECELVERANENERIAILDALATSGHSQAAWAQERLARA